MDHFPVFSSHEPQPLLPNVLVRPIQFQRLHLTANNARFLILPGVRVPHLASRALGVITQPRLSIASALCYFPARQALR